MVRTCRSAPGCLSKHCQLSHVFREITLGAAQIWSALSDRSAEMNKMSNPGSESAQRVSWILICSVCLGCCTHSLLNHVASWVRDTNTICPPQMSPLLFLLSLLLTHILHLRGHCWSVSQEWELCQSCRVGQMSVAKGACGWAGKSGHADTLPTLWNEVGRVTPWWKGTQTIKARLREKH